MDDHIEPERLSLSVVRSLRWIILVSLLGIIVLSAWGLALKYGFVGDGQEETADSADEALSLLGQIGSASVGGLVGFLTRDLLLRVEDSGKVVTSYEAYTGQHGSTTTNNGTPPVEPGGEN